ncbi:hypothetical protein PB2503_01952 [Parvularcula bermudensis HTCC2503]|uniref:Ribbon-helix-helix protein CopG domain-containing protein n=1 Tax=Parvularcula bermudensis (strain ATCC BAA-594 / HTCC2503 / KCTC 12087) TaxID=314260 RepID=E0TBX6_PARBH|nr:hypothetical protein [Parvularcula bermudensis]ADM08469.1 hypothetical protein PB2503_01952 [Parvularcula bermudensis HTCC2503]
MVSEKRLSKLQVLITETELATIDDWRFANRADSRSSAVRELIALGLKLAESSPEQADQVLTSLRKLSS